MDDIMTNRGIKVTPDLESGRSGALAEVDIVTPYIGGETDEQAQEKAIVP